jgi:hypothetical protein
MNSGFVNSALRGAVDFSKKALRQNADVCKKMKSLTKYAGVSNIPLVWFY